MTQQCAKCGAVSSQWCCGKPMADFAALKAAAQALVDALPRCDNGCGSVALNEVYEAQGTAWQYGCDECLKREHWGYCDVDWAPQLRKLLEVLK